VLVAAPAPAAPPAPRRRPTHTIRLATWNLLNLFDGEDDPALSGDLDDKPMTITADRARALAEAIRAVDADVWALQEVESAAALQWFRDAFLDGAGYRYLASFDAGNARGIECSLLSRFEIADARVWPDLALDDVERPGGGWAAVPPASRPGLRMARSPLYAEVRVSRGYTLSIFVLHHKAGADFDFQREAEAVRVIELVDHVRRRDPDANVAVMGDFNAAPWDKSLRLYLEAGLVDTLAHRATRGPEAALSRTHVSDRVLDYILLDGAAYRELVIGSPQVYRTCSPPSGGDRQREHAPPGCASDHFPVVIDLAPRDRK
jgi:endonuclease/exonuclease/phosphatase family metal-dependent hydrolase